MKLLFDQNLSPKLVQRLFDVFPSSSHVQTEGLECADDLQVWEFSRKNGFTIITKDSDFHQLCTFYGHPPKILWLHLGNCTTSLIEQILRRSLSTIYEFEQDKIIGTLILHA
jgi:predicted nuclease of predicted toxin-antitoxin system